MKSYKDCPWVRTYSNGDAMCWLNSKNGDCLKEQCPLVQVFYKYDSILALLKEGADKRNEQQKEIKNLNKKIDRMYKHLDITHLETTKKVSERIEKLEKKTWAISDDGYYFTFIEKEKEE